MDRHHKVPTGGWPGSTARGSPCLTSGSRVPPAKAAAWDSFFTCWKPAVKRGAADCDCSEIRSVARQADFLGDTIVELSIDGDTVLVDLTPHELRESRWRLDET